MKQVQWSTVLLVALPLLVGAALIATGHESEGSKLLLVGTGLIAGLPLTWRKGGGGSGPTLPPPGPLAALLVLVVSAIALTGCGSSAPHASVCSLARAAREPCAVVTSYADRCDADAGQR